MQENDFKYNLASINRHDLGLNIEVKALETKLNNISYLKRNYEKTSKEKNLEIESLLKEIFITKQALSEKSKMIEELNIKHKNYDFHLKSINEECKINQILLEEENLKLTRKIEKLEEQAHKQAQQNLKIQTENKTLKNELKEKETNFELNATNLESQISKIIDSQKITEEKISLYLSQCKSFRKSKTLTKSASKNSVKTLYDSEVKSSNLLKSIIKDLHKKNSEDMSKRLSNQEKRLSRVSSLLSSPKSPPFF